MTTIQTSASTAQQQAIYDLLNESGAEGVEGTAPVAADPTDVFPAGLTPDALLLYCQTRLDGIDSQIDTQMTQQQNAQWEQQAIQPILAELQTDSTNTTSGVLKDPQECQKLEQSIEDLVAQIQAKDPGCSVLGQLEQLHDTVMATGTGQYTDTQGKTHGYYCSNGVGVSGSPEGQTPPAGVNAGQDGTLGGDELQSFTTTLQGISSSLNSNAELGMIQIQSLMSDRTNAISMTTNIMQSYDDGLSKVADNIGK